ncbi:PGRPLA family protein [Megaselia abdita]
MKLLLKVNSERTRKRHNSYNSCFNDSGSSNSSVSNSSHNHSPRIKRINQNRTTQSSKVLQKITDSSKLIIVLVFIVIIIISLVAYFEITKPRFASAAKREILFGNDYNQGTFPNLGNGHLVIDREQWGASDQPTNLTIPLDHPVPYVLITHVGVQNTPCFNVYKCSIKMRTIQDSSVAEKYLPDINSNFYVGNDGNVYVGRGWDYANTYANKSLAVTLIGDFIRYSPSETQFEAIQHLLSYGVAKSYLASDYKLVAQNQTKKTRSPGPTVYKEISKWPRWSPCGTDDNNPPCGIEIGLPTVWDAKQ